MHPTDENGFGEVIEDAGIPDAIIPTRGGPEGWRLPEQSLGLALAAGAIAGIVCAAIWMVVGVMSGRRIGYLALGVGFVVGWVVRKAGRGTSWPFGAVAALLTIASCGLGMILSYTLRAAMGDDGALDLGTLERFLGLILTQPLLETAQAAVNPVDGVFTVVATYQAFQLGYAKGGRETPPVLP